MAVGITPDTSNENPYLTVQEYKDAPTSIDYNNLVVGGNQAAQDAEPRKCNPTSILIYERVLSIKTSWLTSTQKHSA
jgi:hypothetical protein